MGKRQEKSGANARESNQRKRARKWPWVLAGISIVLALIVLLIPVALSSQRFTRWLGAKISISTGGQAGIGNLSVGWFRGVRMADFSFRGQDGWAQVNIDRITTQPNYAGLFSGNLGLDRTVIEQPRVAIDLRHRPPTPDGEPASFDMNNLARLNDVVVRDGSVQLTDTTGKTVQFASFNSTLNMRSAGRTSKFSVSTVVAQAQPPARISASGQVTPDRQQGWTLKGTSGDLTVEVNDLDLGTIAPFLEMAGVKVQAKGVVSADITGAILDGRIENLNAAIVGRNLHVTGDALKGDSLHTSQLNVQAGLTHAGDVINVDRLNVQTDWASLSATGRLPTTVQSMAELTKGGSSYDLKGKFDVNLATVLSQMPNTIGVQKGMEIKGGRATGTINTTTEGGRVALVAETQIAGLAGTVNDKQVSLSKPVQATLRLSTDDKGNAQLDGLNLSAAFAQVTADGNFKQIQYKGQVDLAGLQSELGPFVNLGAYGMAGQVSSVGKISIEKATLGASGSLSAKQFVLTAPDGNSVSEQTTNVEFALGLDRRKQILTVDTLSATAGFGAISIAKTAIPLGQDASTPLTVVASARDVRLAALKPYAVLFASFPKQMGMDGVAQSQVNVTRQNGLLRIFSDATRIQGLTLVLPEKEKFQQAEVTAVFDVTLDPGQKTIQRATCQVRSPQITLKGQIAQTSQGNTVQSRGTLDGKVDLAAVGQVASAFVPGTLDMAGQRQVAVSFASTYPTNDPNGFLANLDSKASLGFDRAAYKGLNLGPTEIDVQVTKGLMEIKPFTTTLNSGKVNFAAQADFHRTPILLKTSGPLQVAQGVQITPEMTEGFLKYVNPIFADAIGVSGIVSFETQSMAIPLKGGHERTAQLDGTIGIQELRLQASLLNKILSPIQKSVRDEVLTIRPTKLALQNAVLRYDDMEIDVGDNPINFGGAIGLNGILDMTVLLPYTYGGRTVRIGEQDQGEKRISVPLTGTLKAPKIELQKLFQQQLQEQILGGLGELLKKSKK
jgi:hypothetical protein